MDKKTQFQLQTSQGKLIKYKESLQNLQDARFNLSNSSSQDNLDRSKVIKLKQTQNNIEAKQQLLKKDINLNVNNISNANKNLLLLDKQRDINYSEEDNILNDELNRIRENIIENKDNHTESIKLSYQDKLELSSNIELIKNELALQNNIISEIQIISHSSRKQTLDELHIKKQDKLITHQHIDNIKALEINFTDQIQELETNNNDIIEFKKLLIDSEYNLDYDNVRLLIYYNKFNNINLDTINEKLALLDKIYSDNQSKIQYINKKFNKNKQSNTIRIKNILETYNTINRVKVIGYKDQFKIEKEKRTQLENVLADMYNKYDNFETNIILTINNDLETANTESENDKLRANERLNIMKVRIIDNYNNEKQRLNNIIINSKLNLENISSDFNNIKMELDNIKEMIEKENIISNEIEKIDNEIIKYQNIIKQIESDIEKLSSK